MRSSKILVDGHLRVYLDTSAYLSILLGESGSVALMKAIHEKQLCSSSFLFLEAERNIVRLSRERILLEGQYAQAIGRLREDLELFILRDLNPELCLTGQFPAIQTPRSSDLIHLRTALWFQAHGGLDSFITLDQRQKQAAKELGLVTSIDFHRN